MVLIYEIIHIAHEHESVDRVHCFSICIYPVYLTWILFCIPDQVEEPTEHLVQLLECDETKSALPKLGAWIRPEALKEVQESGNLNGRFGEIDEDNILEGRNLCIPCGLMEFKGHRSSCPVIDCFRSGYFECIQALGWANPKVLT